MQERRRAERQLDDVVELLVPVAHPEQVAELAEAPGRQRVAARQADVLGLQALEDREHAAAILRIALVVGAVPVDHPPVRGPVDVVRVAVERRQPAGDERLGEPFRRLREVVDDAEPAEALAEHAPALDLELAADQLRVTDDRVGSEVRQVLGLLLRAHPGQVADGSGAARPALVEEEQAVVVERALPPGLVDELQEARRLVPGPALEEDEPREVVVLPPRLHDLARKDGELLAPAVLVIDGHLELVLDEHEVRGAVRSNTHRARFSYAGGTRARKNSRGCCGRG